MSLGDLMLKATGRRYLGTTGKRRLRASGACPCGCGSTFPDPCACLSLNGAGTYMPTYCPSCQPFHLRATLSGFNAVCSPLVVLNQSFRYLADGSHDLSASTGLRYWSDTTDRGWYYDTPVPNANLTYTGTACGGTASLANLNLSIEATVRAGRLQMIIGPDVNGVKDNRWWCGDAAWVDCKVGRTYTLTSTGIYYGNVAGTTTYTPDAHGDYSGCVVTAVICPEGA